MCLCIQELSLSNPPVFSETTPQWIASPFQLIWASPTHCSEDQVTARSWNTGHKFSVDCHPIFIFNTKLKYLYLDQLLLKNDRGLGCFESA